MARPGKTQSARKTTKRTTKSAVKKARKPAARPRQPRPAAEEFTVVELPAAAPIHIDPPD